MSLPDGPKAAESMVEDINALVEILSDQDSDIKGMAAAIRDEAGALADKVSGIVDAPPAPAKEPVAS